MLPYEVICGRSREDGRNHSPSMRRFSKLREVYALPCSQIQSSIRDRDLDRRSDYGRLGMGYRVIRTFIGMEPRERLRNDPVQRHAHVSSNIGVIVLVYGNRGTGMLYKQVEDTDLHVIQTFTYL